MKKKSLANGWQPGEVVPRVNGIPLSDGAQAVARQFVQQFEMKASTGSRSPAFGQTEQEQDEKANGANRIKHGKEPAELWIPRQRTA